MTIFNSLYVYLQRPDNGDWVTIGRYTNHKDYGVFEYAASYLEAGYPWPLDPIEVPIANHQFVATTYGGLHAILRDGCPDAWGKTLLRKMHHLPETTPDAAYLPLATNADRWGALAFGQSKKPSVSNVSSPRLADLNDLVTELTALSAHRPAVNNQLRQRLLQTQSLGGARPKATIKDGDLYWLVKPYALMDIENIPLLEHVTHTWGRSVGLNLAKTEIHHLENGTSVVRVLRFDRLGDKRFMVMSGATLLQLEYPSRLLTGSNAKGSYAQLAQQLLALGAPKEDCQELLGRMLFNYLVGNDDDHLRNHAAIYDHYKQHWRLSQGFDVVPNPSEMEIQLSLGVTDSITSITKESILLEYKYFGFNSSNDAQKYIEELLKKIEFEFNNIKNQYPIYWQPVITKRLQQQIALFNGYTPMLEMNL